MNNWQRFLFQLDATLLICISEMNDSERGVQSEYSVHVQKYLVVSVYSVLFFIGVPGNCWVISIISYILRTLKSPVQKRKNSTYVYILALCCADLIVLLNIPFVLTVTLTNEWYFGEVICKLQQALEHTNKFLSTFILTGLSWDRFMAVCYPHIPKWRSTKISIRFVAAAAISAILLLSPCSYFAGTYVTPKNTTNCIIKLEPPQSYRGLLVYMMASGYCVPVALMTFFYVKIMLQIRAQTKTAAGSHISLGKVSAMSMLVVGFYLLFWTPYWCLMMVISFGDILTHVTVFRFVLALPYTNSALNWIFYALLNRQLRDTHGAAMELNQQSRTLDKTILSSAEKDNFLPRQSSDSRRAFGLLSTQSSHLSDESKAKNNILFDNKSGSDSKLSKAAADIDATQL